MDIFSSPLAQLYRSNFGPTPISLAVLTSSIAVLVVVISFIHGTRASYRGGEGHAGGGWLSWIEGRRVGIFISPA